MRILITTNAIHQISVTRKIGLDALLIDFALNNSALNSDFEQLDRKILLLKLHH